LKKKLKTESAIKERDEIQNENYFKIHDLKSGLGLQLFTEGQTISKYFS
jgi:hypothetical protein